MSADDPWASADDIKKVDSDAESLDSLDRILEGPDDGDGDVNASPPDIWDLGPPPEDPWATVEESIGTVEEVEVVEEAAKEGKKAKKKKKKKNTKADASSIALEAASAASNSDGVEASPAAAAAPATLPATLDLQNYSEAELSSYVSHVVQVDENGSLNRDQLQKLLASFPFDLGTVDEIMLRCDANGDGVLDKAEFVAMIRRGVEQMTTPSTGASITTVPIDPRKIFSEVPPPPPPPPSSSQDKPPSTAAAVEPVVPEAEFQLIQAELRQCQVDLKAATDEAVASAMASRRLQGDMDALNHVVAVLTEEIGNHDKDMARAVEDTAVAEDGLEQVTREKAAALAEMSETKHRYQEATQAQCADKVRTAQALAEATAATTKATQELEAAREEHGVAMAAEGTRVANEACEEQLKRESHHQAALIELRESLTTAEATGKEQAATRAVEHEQALSYEKEAASATLTAVKAKHRALI